MSSNDTSKGMSTGAMVGIAIGCIFALGILVGIIMYFTVFKKNAATTNTNTNTGTRTGAVAGTGTGTGTQNPPVPVPVTTQSTTPSAPILPVIDPRIQANVLARANIQPYTCPAVSYGYPVQAIKRNNPDYTLESFNRPEFDSLASANDGDGGAKFAGFKKGIYLIGGKTNSLGTATSGEYMYCRIVGTGTATDPRRIACGIPSDPLKFDTKGTDFGYDGTQFFGYMCGGTSLADKTTLCRDVGNGELACYGLDSNNKVSVPDQYNSIRLIRPKTDGLP